MKTGLYPMMTRIDYIAADGINQSFLKSLSKSEAHLQYALNSPRSGTTNAQLIGLVVESLVLGTELAHAESPYDDYRSKDAREWRDTVTADGLLPIKPADLQLCKDISSSVLAHPYAMSLIAGGEAQVAAFDELTLPSGAKVKRKALFDLWNPTQRCIVDLKVTCDASPASVVRRNGEEVLEEESEAGFIRQIYRPSLRYDVQAAFYLSVAENATGGEACGFGWIAVEADPPHACAVYVPSSAMLEIARQDIDRWLERYAAAIKSGVWPGYSQEPEFVDPPRWKLIQAGLGKDIGK